MLGTKPRAQRLLARIGLPARQRRARARRLPRTGDGALEAADPGGSCHCLWSSNRSLQGLDQRDSAAWRPAGRAAGLGAQNATGTRADCEGWGFGSRQCIMLLGAFGRGH